MTAKEDTEYAWTVSAPFSCEVESTFATSGHLANHKRTYACDFPGCTAAFATLDHLANHKRTHTGEKAVCV